MEIEICIKAFDTRKGMELCTIIRKPDKNGYVLIVNGHRNIEEAKNAFFKMQKKADTILTFEELSEGQKKRAQKKIAKANRKDEILNEMDYYFHSLKDGSATQNDKKKLAQLQKELEREYIN